MISKTGLGLAFLIGAPRSGTTLLSAVISKAPGVLCPPELWIALPATEMARTLPALVAPDSDRALSQLAISEAFNPTELGALLAEFLASAYSRVLARRQGATVLVDKTPRYYKIASLLAELLPDARFIVMARNPLDIAASQKSRWKVDLARIASPEGLSAPTFDVFCAPRCLVDLREQLGSRAHFLRYEDLVSRSPEIVSGVCDFLELPYEGEYLDYAVDNPSIELLRSSSLGDRDIWNHDAIHCDRIEPWRGDLSDNEARLVCQLVGADVFAALDYPCPYPDAGEDEQEKREFLRRAMVADIAGGAVAPDGVGRVEIATLRNNLTHVSLQLAETEAMVTRERSARESEAVERERWQRLCGEAEDRRDRLSVELEREMAEKENWEILCRQAENQRDLYLEELGQESQRFRELGEELEAQREQSEIARESEIQARLAEAQEKERWQHLCNEAEHQRDQSVVARESEIQARLAEAQEKERWQRLCNEAEHQRDQYFGELGGYVKRWQDLASLWPWLDTTSDEDREEFPLISVVTPSYNQARWIDATIQSILQQNYPNFEHIIVDGGSTDETAAVVATYPHVRFVCEPDLGQAHAINKGLFLATGDIVAYLNSDDLYRPGAFHVISEAFRGPDDPMVIVGGCDYVDEEGETIGHMDARLDSYWDLQRYWGWERWFCLPQQSVFWRRDVLAEVGVFNTSFQYTMDYELWLRIAARHPFSIIDETLAAFRMQAKSKTLSNTHNMYIEERRASRMYWPRWWRPSRWYLEIASLHHIGVKMLDVAEHEALSNRLRLHSMRLLGLSLRHWPLAAFWPRFLLTAASALTANTPLEGPTAWFHRAYLHLRWLIGPKPPADQ